MTSILFIRHAQPDNANRNESVRPLTTKGRKDALDLIAKFGDAQIDSIYSSPYTRAIETVEPLARIKEIPILIREDLRERNTNTWYATIEEFREFARKQWGNFDHKVDGGESLREVQERNIKAVSEILKENKDKSVIVATHGTALSTIVNYYDDTKGFEWFQSIVDRMPFCLRMEFEEQELRGMEEI
jgi:2,3-bisphosphoglycerate-dependent phosphoglycerate mutase